ncbi:MAG: hypothetical protein V8T86_07925 [Victivallis sp.]
MFQAAVQLYSFRDQCAKDFVDVLKLVSIIGFKGVAAGRLLRPEAGGVPENRERPRHGGLFGTGPWCRSEEQIPEIVDTLGELGLSTCVCGFGPNEFRDMDAIRRTAEMTTVWQEKLEKQGITLFQHNHAFEFDLVDGRPAYDIYAELCPKMKFEIDCYWSANHGKADPVEVMKRYRERTILIHMKDGVLDPDIPLIPLGSGKLPIPAILAEADPKLVKWVIVELDNCAIDIYRGIKKSYQI